ncbi:hypothetical protein CASFOL_007152 [Castilleja foliolosa]|uniref:Late embryogenesis abundant protein LEA-2 subgroup domain-containing protein n=1 Tax=Castilleja foliolosa TaxID=1961234 RepID=A0ABD3ECJ6_9LAMI
MTDRAYQSMKPNGTTNHPVAAAPIPNPPPKSHPYNLARHPYRPTPVTRPRHKHENRRITCRRCCCLTCFWSILILIAILLLAAIAAAALYVLYHPHRPIFSVTSLKISAFNLTTTPADDSTHLSTRMNVTLSVRNPNKSKITYLYGPMTITVQSNSIDLSNGTIANFTSSPGNISILHTTMAMNSIVWDADSVKSLKSDLKRKRGLPMEIVVDTTVGVKMEKLKVKKVGIRIRCGRIHGVMPKGKNVTSSKTANAECTVDLKIKILKWTF